MTVWLLIVAINNTITIDVYSKQAMCESAKSSLASYVEHNKGAISCSHSVVR